MRKNFSSFAKTYCTILTLATLCSFVLDPRLGYIFGLDFVLTAVLRVLGLPASAGYDFSCYSEYHFAIICGYAAIIICLLIVVARICWNKHKKFSAVVFITITALDCTFVLARCFLDMAGPRGIFYFGGSLLWKSVGFLCLATFLTSEIQNSKSGQKKFN